ncbi:beta-galactosidase [Paenibacillus arenilitoris]|uniref:Beta-galactosidase n=1 Tax=Paenibacillus arenilitoris TaxID=2772299 RepID=A0A927CMC2_9BACL|nr:beta-galactosidase [Paenibacillus arenilitoris]MBD2868806.1 beta-galactosidase [Paenibacillus arenilitoris]
MSMETRPKTVVQFDSDAVRIHGKPHILLCASLFYFRIPRRLWKERMLQLKAFGYNSIDVYFPWNYHERREGEWDFDGERDVAAFLDTAKETGLWVVARPGPYICSEWDGGALPAYLLAKEDMKLRDNDPAFLGAVASWFDRILPILKAYQEGEGGSVIAVQLDNELDFYGCDDPPGYIAALRDMALARGIAVPLFACAGQGGLPQASGLADGVMPTCNFYPDDRDPEFEEKVLHYRRTLAERGYPLLVTETNRAHYLLRRLLSCGAKLLGPYLQASGTDFGFTNATNNWGKPLAFMASDYDFGGMISPEGHIREEAYEGRLLGRLIEAYGASLAEAAAEEDTVWTLEGDAVNSAGPFALRLKTGGSLLFVTNLEDRDKEAAIAPASDANASVSVSFTLRAGRSLTLPSQVPLIQWGWEGVLEYSTAELYMAEETAGGTVLALHTEGRGEIGLKFGGPVEVSAEQAAVSGQDGTVIVRFDGQTDAACVIQDPTGRRLKLLIHDRLKALHMEGLDENGDARIGEALRYPDLPSEEAAADWTLGGFEASEPMTAPNERISRDKADYLEREGIYRGYAWYEAAVRVPEGRSVKGVLIRQGSDAVSLYAGGEYAGTVTPGGGTAYIPLGEEPANGRLVARTEIWGHSNFDDIRLPALRLNAMKGLRGMAAVTEVRELSRNWSLYRAKDRTLRKEHIEPADDGLWPVVGFGGWMSPDHPAFEYYRKSFAASEDASSWTLHFQGLGSLARLFVNGEEVGAVHPFDPYVDITPYVTAGETVRLTVFLERVLGLPAGRVTLYEGVEAEGWTISGAEEEALLEHAKSHRDAAVQANFPVTLQAGETAWLQARTVNSEQGSGWRAKVSGSGLKLTAFMEGRIVGRLWLPCESNRPVVTGGSPDSFYLPGVWYADGKAALSILLEAVDPGKQGTLESIRFVSV